MISVACVSFACTAESRAAAEVRFVDGTTLKIGQVMGYSGNNVPKKIKEIKVQKLKNEYKINCANQLGVSDYIVENIEIITPVSSVVLIKYA